VCDVLEADPAYLFRHGHTFSGHTAACAACLANVDIIEREGLVARADRVGARLSAGLRALAENGAVRGARGVGALWSAQLHGGEDVGVATAVRDAMLDLGVIVRPLYDSIAFCPPLVMEDEDVDAMVDALARAVGQVDREYRTGS
jgi:adenosylmethionine-8-amino-7-oxononanoate aminotransferase